MITGNGPQCIAGLDCVRFSSLGRRPRCHCRGILWEFREGRKFAGQTKKMVQRGLNRFLSGSSAFYVGCFGNHYMRTRIIDSLLGRSNDATKALRLGHPSLTTRGRPPPTGIANWVVDRCPPPPPVCLFVCDFCTCCVFFFLSLLFPRLPYLPPSRFSHFVFCSAFVLHLPPCMMRDCLPCPFAGVLAHLPLGSRPCSVAPCLCFATAFWLVVDDYPFFFFVVVRVCL